jgi:hypothetical protein
MSKIDISTTTCNNCGIVFNPSISDKRTFEEKTTILYQKSYKELRKNHFKGECPLCKTPYECSDTIFNDYEEW